MQSVTKMWIWNKRFPVDTKSYFAGKTCVGKAQLGETEIISTQLALTAKNQQLFTTHITWQITKTVTKLHSFGMKSVLPDFRVQQLHKWNHPS